MKRCLCIIAAVLCVLAAGPARAANSADQALISKLHWRSIGPFFGGRVVAVAGVSSEPNVFYFGGVQAGIWRSTDYGMTWDNISDKTLPADAYSIGAIAVAPSNPKIIYAGTGESDIRQDFAPGSGLYKSSDAGKTWHYTGLRDTHQTSSIAIDPRNPNVVYLSSMGHVFKPNSERGVFKTTDGGKTWKNILFVDDETGANQVVLDPRNPNVVYAAMWQARRFPWKLTSGGPGSALYKSTDGGAHWEKISSNPGFARGMLGKIGVAVAANNPRIVYAIAQAHDGGVFRSTDGGATWKHVNAEWKLRQRAFYYTAIYVDPTNPNLLYAPEVDSLYKSTDGGKTWKTTHSPFGDNHIVWINPRNPKILLLGNDGGASISVNGGQTWSTQDHQPTGQYYHVALDSQFPYHLYGAAQDEGAYEGPSSSHSGLTNAVWHVVAQGESTFVAPQPNDPDITYGFGYYSYLARVNMVTGNVKNVSPWPKYMSGSAPEETRYRFGWTHPMFFSPVDPKTLLATAQVVFKSEDYGQTWTAISPDLTRNDKATEGPSGGPIAYDQTNAETFPDISALAVSPLSGQVIWAGSADGLVHVTTDGGAHWKRITPPQLPQWAQISSIEPSHTDAGTAFLSANRYMWDDFHPYVYETTDYGAHWKQIANGLPADDFVFVVRQDPSAADLLFAGTRSSVYVSLNGGAQWQPLKLNLPYVEVRDLAINQRQGELAAATHGRAFWILDNLALLEQLSRSSTNSRTAFTQMPTLFTPQTAWITHAYGGSGSDGAGENAPYGATVFFTLPRSYDGHTPVTLSFLDSSGKTIRSYSLHLREKHPPKYTDQQISEMDDLHQRAVALRDLTAIEPGVNAFRWDLRYPPAADVRGYHAPTSDDVSDSAHGPTILPGTYTAVLDYGGTRSRRGFAVKLDPRFHPSAGALESRLALELQISDTLNQLDTAVNAAFAAAGRLAPPKRAALLRYIDGNVVQMKIESSEGDTMNEVRLRSYLGFLLNELDIAYDAPTAAEQALYRQLRAQAVNSIAQLRKSTAVQ